jgi:hypothetical protein
MILFRKFLKTIHYTDGCEVGERVARLEPVGVGLVVGGGFVWEGVAPTDIEAVAVFVGVIVCVRVAEGESVTRAVTLGVIVFVGVPEIVFVAVFVAVFEDVIVFVAVLVAVWEAVYEGVLELVDVRVEVEEAVIVIV